MNNVLFTDNSSLPENRSGAGSGPAGVCFFVILKPYCACRMFNSKATTLMQKVERLLLVDDDYVSNMLTEMAIKDMQLAVTDFQVTANGQEALDYLEITARTDPSAFPQLILLDLNMPVMDGFEFLEKVTRLKLPSIPDIIVLSSSSSPADLERAAAFPIAGYLNKPIQAETLLPLLQKRSSD